MACRRVFHRRVGVAMCLIILVVLIIAGLWITLRSSDVNGYPKQYAATKGEVWPQPQKQTGKLNFYVLESSDVFDVSIPNHGCDILNKAVSRLIRNSISTKFTYVRSPDNKTSEPPYKNDVNYEGSFTSNTQFQIVLTKECEKYPYLEMDESYNLSIGESIQLSSRSIWGILRGLETFNHLLYFSKDYSEIRVNATDIIDFPAYAYRGLLVDTGRHYLSTSTLHNLLDALEMNKMNVLHWHIVDDQNFPYQSEKFPALSKKGAFHQSMVYTKQDIKDIIEHGRLAGIRVVPEFDVPGHTRSWGEAYPDLLTECFSKHTMMGLGPLNPTKNETYTFLRGLYQEVKEVFPDEYIHLGGDEVNLDCWNSNPKVRRFMKEHAFTVKKLHAYFIDRATAALPSDAKFMVWQEVFDNHVPIPEKTLVQVWKYKWVKEMVELLSANQRIVFSSSWYLDYLNQGWEIFYTADPRLMVYSLIENKTKLEDIIGGEACMWGEMADDSNIMSRTWPRASAVAERLWSGVDVRNPPAKLVTVAARQRIEEHTCRMKQRGVHAQPPNGPGFCIGPKK